MTPNDLTNGINALAVEAGQLSHKAASLAAAAAHVSSASGGHEGLFMSLFSVFVLACFVGYYVVWRVTPALHSPLMAVTNAISSVIIVGALIATSTDIAASKILGFIAITLASINIFGGFIVTQRMLGMFKKKTK